MSNVDNALLRLIRLCDRIAMSQTTSSSATSKTSEGANDDNDDDADDPALVRLLRDGSVRLFVRVWNVCRMH
jgi:hypothetical protein